MGAQYNSSLKDQWDIFTSNLKSPQSFLDMAFYFMIGAALQRRVWLGPTNMPICPNLYTILCGPPGVGKGLSIIPVTQLLRHHKYKGANMTEEQKIEKMIVAAQKANAPTDTLVLLRQSKEALEQIKQANKTPTKLEELLFPMGADATTFESLVGQHANAVRVFHLDKPHEMAPSGIYTYHSLCVCVEEASSLFRKHAETIVQYLLAAYNCQDYEYRTKGRGDDIIKRSSLSLLGGTTPEFMRNAFGDRLLGEGFTSRAMFVYADKNRFEGWRIAELTQEQLRAREILLQRLKELGALFGQCRMSEDSIALMDMYFEKIYPVKRKLIDNRIKYYFARKDLHVQKLGLCIWFADNDTMEVPGPAFAKAIDMLEELEKKMHLCLNTKANNPIADLQRDIMRWLGETGHKDYNNILQQFFDQGNTLQIDEALNFLITSGQIEKDGMKYKAKEQK